MNEADYDYQDGSGGESRPGKPHDRDEGMDWVAKGVLRMNLQHIARRAVHRLRLENHRNLCRDGLGYRKSAASRAVEKSPGGVSADNLLPLVLGVDHHQLCVAGAHHRNNEQLVDHDPMAQTTRVPKSVTRWTAPEKAGEVLLPDTRSRH